MGTWGTIALRGAGPAILLALVAAAPGADAATVSIRAEVILASNQGMGVDDRLGAMGRHLSDAFKYSRYELLAAPGGAAQVDQAWLSPLPGGRTLEVTPTSVAGGSYALRVRVLGPRGEQVMSTNVRLRPGGTVFIGGPPQAPGILIIALSAL